MMKPLLLSSMITGMLIAPSVNAVNTHFQPQISSDRPNIILIATEDMNARIGAFGDKVANTPNLDALAKESVRFTNAFTMAGVSAPSRAGLITGVFSHTIGLQHMRTATRPEGPMSACLPPGLKVILSYCGAVATLPITIPRPITSLPAGMPMWGRSHYGASTGTTAIWTI